MFWSHLEPILLNDSNMFVCKMLYWKRFSRIKLQNVTVYSIFFYSYPIPYILLSRKNNIRTHVLPLYPIFSQQNVLSLVSVSASFTSWAAHFALVVRLLVAHGLTGDASEWSEVTAQHGGKWARIYAPFHIYTLLRHGPASVPWASSH